MPQILSTVVSKLNQRKSPFTLITYRTLTKDSEIPSDAVRRMLDSLLAGLEDYTMDDRGDIGSWVRMACVTGLASISETLVSNASSIRGFEEYLPAPKFHELFAGILKQGVERLDNVRQQAGEQIIRLLSLPLPDIPGAQAWRIHGYQLMSKLFLKYAMNINHVRPINFSTHSVFQILPAGTKGVGSSRRLYNSSVSKNIDGLSSLVSCSAQAAGLIPRYFPSLPKPFLSVVSLVSNFAAPLRSSAIRELG